MILCLGFVHLRLACGKQLRQRLTETKRMRLREFKEGQNGNLFKGNYVDSKGLDKTI